jgi:WD40 repeat protein
MTAPDLETVTDFYITGGTLPRDALCYVPRKADWDLLEGLRAGQFCYVLTSRQMGKSSLMVRTAMRLREEGTTCIVLDLTSIGQNLQVKHWYAGLLNQLGQQIGLEDELDDFLLAPSPLGPMQRFMQALQQVALPAVSGNIVIFVDEIDVVRSLAFSADEFFAAIRECYNRRTEAPEFERLTFCLLGVATPSDLIRDVRTTPFNIGRRIELADFTAQEAAALAQGLGGDRRALDRVLHWTGGHPYLTQRLCRAIAEEAASAHDVQAPTESGALEPGAKALKPRPPESADRKRQAANSQVDRLCMELFLTRRAQEVDDNLLFVRERLLRSDADVAALLDLYARVRRGRRVRSEETSTLVSLLRISGIVKAPGAYLAVRNRIYARVFNQSWVRNHMPDAELRRQQQAYRRGLIRAGTASGVALALIGALAGLAIRNEQRAKAVSERLSRQIYFTDMNLLQAAYEAGNLARANELLEQTRTSKYRGFEWGYWNRLLHPELATLHLKSESVLSVVFSPDGRRFVTVGDNGAAQLWDAATNVEIPTNKDYMKRVISLAFSPDGRTVATFNADQAVQLWDAATGARLRVFLAPEEHATDELAEEPGLQDPGLHGMPMALGQNTMVTRVAFSPNGKRIVASDAAYWTAKVWDIATGSEPLTLKGGLDQVNSVAFSSDGKRIIAGCGNRVAKVWDAATGAQILTLPGHRAGVTSAVFSPDGKRIATVAYDQGARLWDAATGAELRILKGHTDMVTSVAFSADSKRIVTGSNDMTAKVWDASTGDLLQTLKGHAEAVTAVAFYPDGKRIVTGSDDGTAKVWDVAADPTRHSLPSQRYRGVQGDIINSIAFSPDSKRVVTSDDGRVSVWNIGVDTELVTPLVQRQVAQPTALSPDGSRIVTGSADNTAKLGDPDIHPRKSILLVPGNKTAKVWDAATGNLLLTLKGHTEDVTSAAFSPDGKRIVTGSLDKTARVWDAATGKPLLPLQGHTEAVVSVAFYPDGERIVTGSRDHTAKVWDASTGSPLLTLQGHRYPVTSVALSPDGKRILTRASGVDARLWDASTGVEIHAPEIAAFDSIAFSPDSKCIVTSSKRFGMNRYDRVARVWDAATGAPLLTLQGHRYPVTFVAFSPDGKRILTISDNDRTARLWDAATGIEALVLKGDKNGFTRAAFSPDGRRLVTANSEGRLQVWTAVME